jgi:hypothetical protein
VPTRNGPPPLFTLRIPLCSSSARVLELDEEGAPSDPARPPTRNHRLDVLGVLCAGADVASGLNAAAFIHREHRGVKLSFKDLKADFLKRADGNVVFRSRDGARIRRAVEQAAATGERVTVPVEVVATVPRKYGDEPVARFTLGLSMKRGR